MRLKSSIGLICLCFECIACSRASTPTSKSDLLKELQTVQSWAATAQFTADAWLHQTVPESYANRSLQKASQEMHRELTHLSSPGQPQLLSAARQLADTTDRLSVAIAHHDRDTVLQHSQQLGLERQQLSALSQSLEKQP